MVSPQEQFDPVMAALADVKEALRKVDAHMEAAFAEMRSGFSGMRSEVGLPRGEFSAYSDELAGIRVQMRRNFRRIRFAGAVAALVILVTVVTGILVAP